MPLQRSKVLVLNSSYEPLSICNAQKAVLLLFGGKAVPIANHPEMVIRTVSRSYDLPSIVRLKAYVRTPYRNILPNRKNIFLRDNFQCQYCGKTGTVLTIDHMVPSSRGGDASWDNLVTACPSCNAKKGNLTPPEASMPPLKPPGKPNYLLLFSQHLSPLVHEAWKPYLYMT
ncbi:MAG: HNH endonuclease [Chlorobiaceae bacterium]|nr:HNH endonuclease [Chlorobiaceae bacterium]